MELIHIGYPEPKAGDDLVFLFKDDSQACLLNKDGKIWLSFKISDNEKRELLRALLKQWLE